MAKPAFSPLPFHWATLVVFLCLVSGCTATPGAVATSIIPSTPTVVQFPAVERTSTSSPTPTPFPASLVNCYEAWQSLPVIPEATEAARGLYQQGVARGNDPRAFSKIGDGEISAEWFLTDFDLDEARYELGDYQGLGDVIVNFSGSFERKSLAARRGFNTHLLLDPSAADPAFCASGESPLECELRIHKPAIAILSLGTNQVHRPEEFETGLRHILDRLVEHHVIPILSTKGDNLEGDHRINRIITCLAREYQLPLWNFWAAIQPLPNHGLQPDLEHLTYYGNNDFDDPFAMQSAWSVRNLTALQVLDAIWRSVTK